jgi:hypothetical protein
MCTERLITALLVFAATASPSIAETQTFTEDFTTTTYRDPMATTVRWDTTTGELKLPPFVPSLAGSFNTPGAALAVVVDGNHAFVADQTSGLQILNITNPASPTLRGSYNTPGDAMSVAVSGDHAFVADGGSGLQVIDIRNPASPTLVGAYDTPGIALPWRWRAIAYSWPTDLPGFR